MKWMRFTVFKAKMDIVLNMSLAICISPANEGGSIIHFATGEIANQWHVAESPDEIAVRPEWSK